MKMKPYFKSFKTVNSAAKWLMMKNRSTREQLATFCLVDGPRNNFAVVDLRTAIELENGYKTFR